MVTQRKKINIPIWLLWFWAVVTLAMSVWIVALQWHLPWQQLWADSRSLPLDALMVQHNTLPRMVMAVLAGASTALATALLQPIMRNPLASDSTLAVGSGAQAALLLVTIFAPTWLLYGTANIAFIGASVALFAVLWLSAGRGMKPLAVVLSGLVMSLYLGAISGAITLFFAEESRSVMQWGSGSLVQDSWHDSLHLAYRLIAACIITAVLAKPLAIMALSDEQAASLGIPVKTIRLTVLLLAAFLSANVVGMVGMMGFTGLAAATLANQSGIRLLPQRLAWSAIFGALLLLFTDNTLVLIKYYVGVDWPAGAVSALIGAPLLLWLMKRNVALSARTSSERSHTVIRTSVWLKALPILLLMTTLAALTIGQNSAGWFVGINEFVLALRYPRVILAAACGVMLAVCGVILQRLTRNAMASPELLGISSGTAVGVMAAVLLFDVLLGGVWFYVVGIVSALVSLLLILWFNRQNSLAPEQVMLTGMALAALSDAGLRVWSAGGDLRIQQLSVWLSGSTYQATPALSLGILAVAIGLLALALPLSRWLALLGLDSVVAQSAGVHISLARYLLIMFAAILTAVATLLIGPLSFVGLLAPHMAAMAGARLPRQQLWTAAALGALLLMLSDWLGRQLLFPYETPTGLVSTLIGGAYFLWLMRKMS